MNHSILLIDDEPLIIEGLKIIVRTYLRNVGDIYTASSAEEGIKVALSQHPEVIISDIRMENMDGLEMIAQLRNKGCRSHFILLSGYAEFDYAKRAISLGVEEYLTKPVEETELVAAWENILKKIDEENDTHFAKSFQSSALHALEECKKLDPQQSPFYSQLLSEGALGELELAIEFLDVAVSRALIEGFFSRMEEEELSFEDAKTFAIHLVLLVLQKLSYAQEESVLEANLLEQLKANEHFKNRNSLKLWVVDIYGKMLKTRQGIVGQDANDVISQAKRYIMENYSKNISLSELSDYLAINPTYFSELFKKKTGMTYKSYLTMVRMHQAKRLLSTTEMKIYEICEAVGYSDVNHLNRMFERVFGMKPLSYRRKNGQN